MSMRKIIGFTSSVCGASDAVLAAVVIHAKADDYKSQPAGNAGDRIACGSIKP